eukprot:TRINITY_DN79884_c0_g1_i1.p1 TRINITY_DN79884_c0_g1~~TRINITY_DN79884_c0_g1_i1.p1  ORF type:complete len:533 (+),score=96.38 TRINITY_DN79884_c0_g1_i1:80-1600(+)
MSAAVVENHLQTADDWDDDEEEFERSICIRRHIATDETQLDLKVDDIVIVLEKDETGWWGGHKENDDFTGWFPGNCVERIDTCVQGLSKSEPGKQGSTCTSHPRDSDGQQTARVGQEAQKVCTVKEEVRPNPMETETASPLRRNTAVASPMTRGPSISQEEKHCLMMSPEPEKESLISRPQRGSEVDQQVIQMKSEIKELKDVVQSLQAKLRQSMQSEERFRQEKDEELQRFHSMLAEEQKAKEEARAREQKLVEQVRGLDEDRRQSMLTVKELHEENRHLKQQNVELKRCPVASPPASASPDVKSQESYRMNDVYETRRQLFQGGKVADSSPDRPSMLNSSPQPTPSPVQHQQIHNRARSSQRGRPDVPRNDKIPMASRASSVKPEEAPASGLVAQMTQEFESRASTPRCNSARRYPREDRSVPRSAATAPAIPALPRPEVAAQSRHCHEDQFFAPPSGCSPLRGRDCNFVRQYGSASSSAAASRPVPEQSSEFRFQDRMKAFQR